MTFLLENLTPPDGRELRRKVREAVANAGTDPDDIAKAALEVTFKHVWSLQSFQVLDEINAATK